MKKYIIIIVIYFVPLFLFSQKHDYNWIAGRYSPSFGMKIDFSNMPFAIQDSLSLAIWMDNSSCAISDKDGNLAFYCNGYRIANAQHEIMQNGNIADGDTLNFDFCPQPGSMIIVPNPKNQNQYYVFTLIYGLNEVEYFHRNQRR